jgi:hypothetical protein
MSDPLKNLDPMKVIKTAEEKGYFIKVPESGKYRMTTDGQIKMFEMVTRFSEYMLNNNAELQAINPTVDEVAISVVSELYNITNGSKDLAFLMLFAFDNNWQELYELTRIQRTDDGSKPKNAPVKNERVNEESKVLDLAAAKAKKNNTFH